jgi:hypothetical protein
MGWMGVGVDERYYVAFPSFEFAGRERSGKSIIVRLHLVERKR